MTSLNLSGPALAAPAGIVPNFEDPPNQNSMAIASFIAMMSVSTTCLLLRFYGKFFVAEKICIEDGLLLAAYGNYWGCTYASFALVSQPGFFVHNWDLVLETTMQAYYVRRHSQILWHWADDIKYIFIFGVFYSMVLAMLKVGILLEWCRVFVPKGTERSSYFWWCSMTVITIQVCFGIAGIFLLNFQCVPHKAIWDFTITEKTCLPLNALQLTSATIHLVSDVAIFLLPQRIIWTLNMSFKKRLGVAVVFSLGALAVICSIFRMTATITFGQSSDTMYTIGPVILWATGEMSCGFFVACMPTLPRLLQDAPWIRRLMSTFTSTNGDSLRPPGQERTANSIKMSRNMKLRQAYLEIDDDAMVLTPSSEPSNNGSAPANSMDRYITRTTHIHMCSSTVTVDKEPIDWK